LTTDADGVARFSAPLARFFLSALYFDDKHLPREGEYLTPGSEHVLRKIWDKPPERNFIFRIRRPDGTPSVAEVFVGGDGCDRSGFFLGKTNAAGNVSATFSLDDAVDIWIGEDGYDDRRFLTPDESEQLERTGEITIVWPHKPK
jgi:hypothetical protein